MACKCLHSSPNCYLEVRIQCKICSIKIRHLTCVYTTLGRNQNIPLQTQLQGPQTELSGMQFLATIYSSEPGHYVNSQSGFNIRKLSMSYDNRGATPSVQRVVQIKWKYANFKHIL